MTLLRQDETAGFDPGRIDDLFTQLGPAAAEELVCRTLEELAARLTHAERCHRRGRLDEMRKTARGLCGVSDQLGLVLLARVARDVIACAELGDRVALAATLARLLRVGERSLTEVWAFRDT
ncbi:hypothetical protein [Roseovarius salis]|uniref:hypothetical protein n=1 Tax=Roseovarius salis TaxID=3376063 RepID=UPI0037CAE226